MFGYDLTVLGVSVGAGLATRRYTAKAIESIPAQAKTCAKMALSLAVGVGIAFESENPLLSVTTGTATTGALWFLISQVSGYVKPVVSNVLGMAVTGSSLYAGFGLFNNSAAPGDGYGPVSIDNYCGPMTSSTEPCDPHSHGHPGFKL